MEEFTVTNWFAVATVVAVLTIVFVKKSMWKRNQPEREVPENLMWRKVGSVEQLYIYPLKSGQGRSIIEGFFTETGLLVNSLRDRMFLVYKEENGRFRTGRNYPKMLLIKTTAVNERSFRFEAEQTEDLIVHLPKSQQTVNCTMWFGETLRCCDCGNEAAEWFSKLLTGENSGLRLGYFVTDGRDITNGPWDKFMQVYHRLRKEDTGLFSDLASYMLMTTASVDDLNQKLEKPVTPLQFRPNLVVSESQPFDEDNWEWIRIGESAVIRNVKPCTRCKMTKIDPISGLPDEHEPLRTLKTYRELADPQKSALDGGAPAMGIYCGLYRQGKVQIADEVFVGESTR